MKNYILLQPNGNSFSRNIIKGALYPVLTVFITIGLFSCTYNHLPQDRREIILINHPVYPGQPEEDFSSGVKWLFSYLGATLPADHHKDAMIYQGSGRIRVHLNHLGFSPSALSALEKMVDQFKSSEEYRLKNGMDAGRFFAVCFNSSKQYYALVNAPPTYQDFLLQHPQPVLHYFACDSSAIATEGRLLSFPALPELPGNGYFIAEEGSGFFSNQSFASKGIHEVFDYMPNGQPRFMIYDHEGQLSSGVPPASGKAGKPAKCMWCHESTMLPLFKNNPDISGYMSSSAFTAYHAGFTEKLKKFHLQSQSALDFSDKKAHTLGEYIYLGFYEPDVSRLAAEWNTDTIKVKQILSGISPHKNPEFPFLSRVYYRFQVEPFSPFRTIRAATDAREYSAFEPDYLN